VARLAVEQLPAEYFLPHEAFEQPRRKRKPDSGEQKAEE